MRITVVCVCVVCSVGQELWLAMCMFSVYHNGARFQIIKLIKTRARSVATITLSCSYEVFKAFLLGFCHISAWPRSDPSLESLQQFVPSAARCCLSAGLCWFCSSAAGASEHS